MKKLLQITALIVVFIVPLLGRATTLTATNTGALSVGISWSSFDTVGDNKHITMDIYDTSYQYLGSATFLVENHGGYARVQVESASCDSGYVDYSNAGSEWGGVDFTGFSGYGNSFIIEVYHDYVFSYGSGGGAYLQDYVQTINASIYAY